MIQPFGIAKMYASGVIACLCIVIALEYAMAQGQDAPAINQRDNAMKSDVRYRGFNVESGAIDPEDMRAAADWGANQVRVHMISRNDARRDKISLAEQFDRELAALPAGLDAARAAGLAVVLVMPQRGTHWFKYTGTDKEQLAQFWDDESNLEMFVDAWKRIAAICRGRDQVIWYDIVNEPLDWRDFPAIPQKWPAMAQAIIDAIRTIDPVTPIVIESGPGGLCRGMSEFPVPARGGPFIFSVHSYSPHEFTHQGLSDISNTDLARAYLERQIPWPHQRLQGGKEVVWDRAWLEEQLAPAIEFQKRHPEIPIYVGEFSAIRWAPGAVEYLRDNLEIFEKYGWHWSYHCFRGFPGWSLEHDNAYSDPAKSKLSPTPTDRAQLVRAYLARNRASGE
jgi:hypothetical protein